MKNVKILNGICYIVSTNLKLLVTIEHIGYPHWSGDLQFSLLTEK